ncbi:MAG: DUF748 domain-containing protein [Desulfuromonadaceae bacterium]|nr:DUF748 domain-containing protein [Desulfuromonadaceae bacterium]
MTRRKKISLIAAGIIAALLLFATFVLPLIVRSQAVKAIEAETGRKTRIEKISINPLTLTVTVKGLSITAKDGGPFISFATLRTSLGMASIYRRALILSEVSIDSPAIAFARLGANNYNFNDIIELQKAKEKLKPKEKSKGAFHFSVNNISLTNGSVDFDDRAVDGGRKHTVRALNVAIPFISNIPYLVEKYTAPHISAVVNGAPFSFNGKFKPLSKSMETSVHIDLKQLSLPEYVAYSPVRPPADLASGKLTIAADVTYRISKDSKPVLGIKGEVNLDGAAVNMRDGQPLVRLPRLRVKASDLEVFARRFIFDEISVDGLELFVSRNPKGEWMYSSLLPSPQKGAEKAKTEPAAAPENDGKEKQLLLQVAAFSFKNGTVHFRDAVPSGGFTSEISRIDASVKNFTTAADKSAGYELSMMLDNEATFGVDGAFSLTPLKITMSNELSGLKIQRGWPYLSGFLTSPLKGTVDFSSEAAYSRENGLAVEQGKLLVNGLSARYGDKEGLNLSRLEINDAAFSQKTNAVEIGEVKLVKGDMSLSREADGTVSILSLLKKPQTAPGSAVMKSAQKTAGKPAAAVKGKQPAPRLSFRLKKILVDRFNVAVTDKTLREKPRFTLKNTSLSLADLTWPKFKPAAVRFSSTFNKATPLTLSGTITPLPFRYKGRITVGRLQLRDFEDYFPSNINVFIIGGYTGTDMNVDVSLKDGKPYGSFKGNASVRGFHAVDTIAEEDLLKWESLQLDGIQGSLEPFSLAMRQVALNGVYSRIIIRKDGTLNLQNLVAEPEQGTAGTVQQAADKGQAAGSQQQGGAPPAPQSAAAPRKRNISIGAVTVQDGTISFTDSHLSQSFASTFYNVGGRISGLSSEDAKFADVDLRGNLENHSPLQISGQINPLRDDLYVNLKLSFRDIELSPVTPYTGTFLGYAVEKGKLYLDLSYHIEKKQLNSANKVFIDQLTFGKKVASDKATNLPVKLALALLKDRKGEIHLDLPVTGRTDDPQFSIFGLIWQVVKNVLVKAASSPLSLLSSMFGSGGQDFSVIQFSPGTSTISPQEELKLTALAKGLLDRPALKVELKGYVDREKDGEGYRDELLSRKLKNEKLLALTRAGDLDAGTRSGDIQVKPEEYAKYLTAVYKKEKFPKPRNLLGMAKNLPPEEMKKLIITNTVVGDAELTALARERVVAVKNFLVTKGNVPAERVFQKNGTIFKAPGKETISRSRVELDAIVP